jgi:hypothetical protein
MVYWNESVLIALFSVIQQEDSWARFEITKDTCQKILSCHNVFLPFLDCLHSFGLKTEEDSRIWDGFQAAIGRPSAEKYHGVSRVLLNIPE